MGLDIRELIRAGLDGNLMMQGDIYGTGAAVCLIVLAVCLLGVFCAVRCFTVRVYNWNGKRYCYLGRVGLRRENGGYRVRIGERMADLSYTTLYQLCPPKRFIRRNRYKDMVLCAGKTQCVLPVDNCMRQSVYFREQQAK